MRGNSKTSTLSLVPVMLSTVAVALGCLMVGVALYFLVLSPNIGATPSRRATPTAFPSVTPTLLLATSTPSATPTVTVSPPTEQPDQESATTASPSPTESLPQPTNPPLPTATPPPSPTAAPSPTPPPSNDKVKNVTFSVQNPTVAANQGIIFNFSVTNASTTEQVQLGKVGVVVFKDGVNVHFHTSWTGWVLAPGKTDTWQDNLAIGTPGVYQLQLSICFSSIEACEGSGGDWRLMAQPVTVTVN